MRKYQVCRTCNIEKELSIEFFYKRKNLKSGFDGECRECATRRALRNRKARELRDPKHKEDRLKREARRMAENRKCPEFRRNDIKRKREYYWENKNEISKKWQKYYQENREEVLNRNRERKSERQNILSTFTDEQWELTKKHFGGKCAYCGSEEKELTRDHVTPISKGGYNVKSNIVPACKGCNSSKRDKGMESWFKSHNFYNEDRLLKILEWTNYEEENMQMALI